MYTAMFITMVALTQGAIPPPRCSEYCEVKLLKQWTNRRPDCDCSKFQKDDTHFSWADISPLVKFDDSGIYYEPADTFSLSKLSFLDEPFFIVNPVAKLDHRITTIKQSTNKNIHPEYFSEGNRYARKQLSPKYHIKEQRVHEYDIETNKENLYLDLDLHDPETRSESNTADLRFIDDYQRTEHDMLECLDLHKLANDRKKNNNTMKHSGKNKLHKDSKSSDSELKDKINTKCNLFESTVEKSLNAIKKTLPKIKYDTDSTDNKKNANRMEKVLADKTEIEAEDLTTSTSMVHLSIIPTGTKNIIENKFINEENKNHYEHQKIPLELEQNNSMMNTFGVPKSFEETRLLTSSLSEDTITTITEEKSTPKPDNEIFGKKKNKEVTNNAELILTTVYDMSFTSTTASPRDLLINQERQFESTETSYYPSTSTTASNIYEDRIELGSNAAAVYNNENRTEYKEEEIKMTKIVTKEFPNDTVVSSADGFEIIPNDDFLSKGNDSENDTQIKSLYSNSESDTKQINPNISHNLTYLLNNDALESRHDTRIPGSDNVTRVNETSVTHNTDEDLRTDDIKGRLYFMFDKKNIPARFIQKSNGNIHIGLEVTSLCDNFKNNSTLLTLLCR